MESSNQGGNQSAMSNQKRDKKKQLSVSIQREQSAQETQVKFSQHGS
jgi:hypothetical protein